MKYIIILKYPLEKCLFSVLVTLDSDEILVPMEGILLLMRHNNELLELESKSAT